MGLIIVTIVGAVMGWLAAIVVDRDDRAGTALCAGAGTTGALVGAILSGDVPLIVGVSANQLLWSAAGALLAIVVMNVIAVNRLRAAPGNV
jgi:uncharacterized membrane protein YeaQ/YmgE (transglycosylase-associated protein family)